MPEQVSDLAALGFKAVICNRPDGEDPVKPGQAAIAAAAEQAGLDFRYIPIVPGLAGADEVRQTIDAIRELPEPVLAFCRSGARSEAMFRAAMAMRG